MKIKSFVFNSNQTNTYIISDEVSHKATIVDCGCNSEYDFNRIIKYVDDEKLHIQRSVCTHLHFDHIWGLSFVYSKYGIETMASKLDEYNLDWNRMCSVFMDIGDNEKALLDFKSFIWIENLETEFYIGDNRLSILKTPGHSLGSVSYYCDNKGVLFSGDVLFENGYGRTDFEGGDSKTLEHSIHSLLDLPEEVIVFPGHGKSFKVSDRRRTCEFYNNDEYS